MSEDKTKAEKKVRGIRRVGFTRELLPELIRASNRIIVSDLPEDARCITARYDEEPWRDDAILWLYLDSEEWEPATEGHPAPILHITYKDITPIPNLEMENKL